MVIAHTVSRWDGNDGICLLFRPESGYCLGEKCWIHVSLIETGQFHLLSAKKPLSCHFSCWRAGRWVLGMMLPWQPILARQQDALGECNSKGKAKMSLVSEINIPQRCKAKRRRRRKVGKCGLVNGCLPAHFLLLSFGSVGPLAELLGNWWAGGTQSYTCLILQELCQEEPSWELGAMAEVEKHWARINFLFFCLSRNAGEKMKL